MHSWELGTNEIFLFDVGDVTYIVIELNAFEEIPYFRSRPFQWNWDFRDTIKEVEVTQGGKAGESNLLLNMEDLW